MHLITTYRHGGSPIIVFSAAESTRRQGDQVLEHRLYHSEMSLYYLQKVGNGMTKSYTLTSIVRVEMDNIWQRKQSSVENQNGNKTIT